MNTGNLAVNPHAEQPTSLIALSRSFWRNRQLILQMTRREVVGRYKGSLFGLAWSFFNPLFMLAVYTFVFSVIFKSHWGTGDAESKTQYALVLFVGLIVHGLFAEVLTRAPTLVLSNVNYVKKVVFPLEILPIIAMGAAIFHAMVSMIVLISAFALFNGFVYPTALFLPIILLPFIVLTMGLAWLFASLGVFLRDVSQSIGMMMTILFFLSPVIYPVTSVPEKLRPWLQVNPLTFAIEQTRDIVIWGKFPDWSGFGLYSSIAICVAWGGFGWFQKTRKGFSDVL